MGMDGVFGDCWSDIFHVLLKVAYSGLYHVTFPCPSTAYVVWLDLRSSRVEVMYVSFGWVGIVVVVVVFLRCFRLRAVSRNCWLWVMFLCKKICTRHLFVYLVLMYVNGGCA